MYLYSQSLLYLCLIQYLHAQILSILVATFWIMPQNTLSINKFVHTQILWYANFNLCPSAPPPNDADILIYANDFSIRLGSDYYNYHHMHHSQLTLYTSSAGLVLQPTWSPSFSSSTWFGGGHTTCSSQGFSCCWLLPRMGWLSSMTRRCRSTSMMVYWNHTLRLHSI